MKSSRLISVLLLAGCGLLLPPLVRAEADDVGGLIDVALYAKNDDYLIFTVHQTRLPRLYVMREVLCEVELTVTHPVRKTFELTSVDPHYFALDTKDAVLYFPHGMSSVKQVKRVSCLANPVYGLLNTQSGHRLGSVYSPRKVEGVTAVPPRNNESADRESPKVELEAGAGADLRIPASQENVWHPGNAGSGSDLETRFSQLVQGLPANPLAEPTKQSLADNFHQQLELGMQPANPKGSPEKVVVLTGVPKNKGDT